MNDRPLPGFDQGRFIYLDPQPFSRQGWYMSTGYNLSDSIWSSRLSSGGLVQKVLNKMEFTYRYEIFENLLFDDSDTGENTNADKTQAHTASINLNWHGHQVRTQLNYIWSNEDNGHGPRGGKFINEVRNNILVLNHQIKW